MWLEDQAAAARTEVGSPSQPPPSLPCVAGLKSPVPLLLYFTWDVAELGDSLAHAGSSELHTTLTRQLCSEKPNGQIRCASLPTFVPREDIGFGTRIQLVRRLSKDSPHLSQFQFPAPFITICSSGMLWNKKKKKSQNKIAILCRILLSSRQFTYIISNAHNSPTR